MRKERGKPAHCAAQREGDTEVEHKRQKHSGKSDAALRESAHTHQKTDGKVEKKCPKAGNSGKQRRAGINRAKCGEKHRPPAVKAAVQELCGQKKRLKIHAEIDEKQNIAVNRGLHTLTSPLL